MPTHFVLCIESRLVEEHYCIHEVVGNTFSLHDECIACYLGIDSHVGIMSK